MLRAAVHGPMVTAVQIRTGCGMIWAIWLQEGQRHPRKRSGVAGRTRAVRQGPDPTLVLPGAIWSTRRVEHARGSCVAKVESSATRPHPLDSEGFLCRKTQTQNLTLM